VATANPGQLLPLDATKVRRVHQGHHARRRELLAGRHHPSVTGYPFQSYRWK
jgi:hypothetical protein